MDKAITLGSHFSRLPVKLWEGKKGFGRRETRTSAPVPGKIGEPFVSEANNPFAEKALNGYKILKPKAVLANVLKTNP